MAMSRLNQARQIIKAKPWLIWYTQNFDGLDAPAITEAVLSGGGWDDFLALRRIFGLAELKDIFTGLINKRRVNLCPETVNFFNLYFKRHVSANSN